MEADEALRLIEQAIRTYGEKPLNDLQRKVFRGSWLGQDYKEIHHECRQVKLDHLMRNVGPKLWRSLSHLLTNVLEETIEVRKGTLEGAIQRLHDHLHSHTTAEPEPIIFEHSNDNFAGLLNFDNVNRKTSWGDPPSVIQFQGRNRELLELQQWIEEDWCRLVAIVGTAGIGKTALSVKLTEHLRDRFEFVVWRSLDPAITGQPPPLLPDLLTDLLQVLSDQLPSRRDLAQVLEYLRNHRCLIVLDGFDAVLRGQVLSGEYLTGYEGYGDLLKRLSDTHHLSCLLLTSREKPGEIEEREGASEPVRFQQLFGLRTPEVQNLFSIKGDFIASDEDWRSLVHQYDGNPRFLQQVATTITYAFGRDVSRFLSYRQNQPLLGGDMRRLLDQQVSRLSAAELSLLRSLTQHREPATLEEIQQIVSANLSQHHLLDVLLSLVRRSLLNNSSTYYSMHSLILEYVSEDL